MDKDNRSLSFQQLNKFLAHTKRSGTFIPYLLLYVCMFLTASKALEREDSCNQIIG